MASIPTHTHTHRGTHTHTGARAHTYIYMLIDIDKLIWDTKENNNRDRYFNIPNNIEFFLRMIIILLEFMYLILRNEKKDTLKYKNIEMTCLKG